MRSLGSLVLGFMLVAPAAEAATITGTVTGPDGAPFRGAFVQARHGGLKMTVSVLSDNEGRYVVENLPAGDYRVLVKTVGYKADVKAGVKLEADQNAAYDFALQKAPIRWSDISIYQGAVLLPDARGKKTLFDNCMSCHGFQSKMAATVRDEDGWRDRVSFMREAMRSSLADRQGFSDQQAEDVVSYLTTMFGENSPLPKSPADLPAYKDTLITFSDEALKIVYVDFEMPGPNRFPWTANPDKDGLFWIPEYGQANKVARLNSATGEIKEFPAPNLGPALIHSAVPAPDGSVWITEAGSKKLGHWDPVTQKITEYQDDWRKHTIRIHPDGSIWSTGGLTRFDPEDGDLHSYQGSAVRLWDRPRSEGQCLVHRDDQDRSHRQGRPGHPEGDEIHSADPGAAASHPGRRQRRRVVLRIRRRQDRPLRSEGGAVHRVCAAASALGALRARRRT